jgi:hypothetical protein
MPVLEIIGFILTIAGVLFASHQNSITWLISIVSPLLYTYGLQDYQKKRVTDFLSEKPSSQVQQSLMAIGSGGSYALAAARALLDTDLNAMEICEKSMKIAAEMCVYTNNNFVKDVTIFLYKL